ncbi:hypothetical protein CALCODRAFT_487938 [Calocera cornea HHB12733]|uniref:Uncharacterized protein n=1 Tax=Calocera cornea HHB12733 TaxID=1353952 RepID=A0A165CUR2_9BASI|nr:hypothetical protein CALCODRAFT_487938 [Calocera cornea HHB12733]
MSRRKSIRHRRRNNHRMRNEEILGTAPEEKNTDNGLLNGATPEDSCTIEPPRVAAAAPEMCFLLEATEWAMDKLLDKWDSIAELGSIQRLPPASRALALPLHYGLREQVAKPHRPRTEHSYPAPKWYRRAPTPKPKPKDETEALLLRMRKFRRETDRMIVRMKHILEEFD